MNTTAVKILPHYKLQQAIAYMQAHLAESLTLEMITAHIGMSQFHFCRLFKQAMGISPYQYLLQQRIEQAKQLLLQRNLGIADIALEVGFTDQSHFCYQFKRFVGETPKQFLHQYNH